MTRAEHELIRYFVPLFAACWGACACVKSAPTPIVHDTDSLLASPTCVKACEHLESIACVQMKDCPDVFTRLEAEKFTRAPATGLLLTCADVLTIATSANAPAHGVACAIAIDP